MVGTWVKLFCCGALIVGLSHTARAGETLLSVSFARGAWEPDAWTLAKNPTVPHAGHWVQRKSCIENETPADPARKSDLDLTLTTMVYGKRFAGDYTVAATFEIGSGAAPGITLVQDWVSDSAGRPEYNEFYEVVIYQKGVNLWHHFARDGKREIERVAYAEFPLKADTPYRLDVEKKGKNLEMTVDGHRIGILLPTLADELYAGVEGCEGVSRVYDFKVTR